jgi:micrococcal nuclease
MKPLALIAALAASPLSAETVPDCGLYAYAAKVIRVIDGDTVVADIDLGFNIWRHNERLRLAGIQTPEEKAPGFQEAKEALADRVSGREVIICTVKAKRSGKEVRGGFGRYLATIWKDGENLNQWLLDEGHAVPYD